MQKQRGQPFGGYFDDVRLWLSRALSKWISWAKQQSRPYASCFSCMDVTATHPLAPNLGVHAAAAAVTNKEARKVAKNAELVATHKLELVSLVLSTSGELGEQGQEFTS